MKCKLCIKCKVYITNDNSYLGNKRNEIFDEIHDKHPMVLIDQNEVKDYECVNSKMNELIAK